MAKILLVDDEVEFRESLKDELEFHGYEVTESDSGEGALKLIEKHSFDAVISDVRMPKGDGFFLIKELRRKTKVPPIFLITGFSDVSAEKAKSLGANDLFDKSYDIKVLLKAIERVVSTKQS